MLSSTSRREGGDGLGRGGVRLVIFVIYVSVCNMVGYITQELLVGYWKYAWIYYTRVNFRILEICLDLLHNVKLKKE